MKARAFVRAAPACAMLASTCLTAPAAAQTVPRQDYIVSDENGVGVTNRQFRRQIVDLSIGSGSAALAFVRQLGPSGGGDPRDMYPLNQYVGYYNSTSWGAPISVELFDRRFDFDAQGNSEQGRVVNTAAGVAFHAKDGTVYRFEQFTNSTGPHYEAAVGLLTDIDYPDGRTTHITWEAAYTDELVGQDACCMERQFTAHTRIASVNNSSGYQLKFVYQSNDGTNVGLQSGQWNSVAQIKALNNVEESIAPLATSIATTQSWPSVSYSHPDRMSVSNPFTVTATHSSGEVNIAQYHGSAINLSGPATGTVTVNYSPAVGGVSSVTADGVTTTYSVPSGFNGYAYRSTSPSGRQTTYTSNIDRDRLVSVATPAGTTSYDYDSQKRLRRVTLPEGNYTEYSHDSRSNVTQVRQVAKPGSGLPDMVLETGYAASCAGNINCDRPLWIRDAAGSQTDYSYDPATGQPLTVTLPAPAVGAARPQTRYDYTARTAYYRDAGGTLGPSDTPISVLTSISECATGASCAGGANEQLTIIDYGPAGVATNLLPAAVTTRSGDNAVSAATAFTYDLLGAVLTVDGPLPGTADTTRYRYDSAQRLIGTIGPDPDGAGALKHPAQRITYSSGRVTAVETGIVNSQSDSDWAAMAAFESVGTAYDPHGRPVRTSLIAGGATYAVTQYSYDGDGRPECVAQRMNGAVFGSLPGSACSLGTEGGAGPDRITRTTYDAAGRPMLVQTGHGVAGVQADEVATTYTGNGLPQTVTDAEGNRTTYEYDGHDRLMNTRFPSPTTDGVSAPTSGAGADYEQLGYLNATVGSAARATHLVASRRLRNGSTLTYQYDALGRMTVKTVPEQAGLDPAHTRDVHYGYDLRGLLLHARFDSPSGPGITNNYDALGRLVSSTTDMSGAARTLSYQYDAASNRISVTHPEGQWFGTLYDTAGRPFYLNANPDGSAGIAFAQYAPQGGLDFQMRLGAASGVTRDSALRPASRLHLFAGGVGNGSWNYAYNPAGQLSSIVRDNAYAYAGDYAVDRPYTVNGLNQYSAAGSATFTYDASGNLASETAPVTGTRHYAYDVENRLVSATGQPTSALHYDPLGRLFQVSSVNGTTRFLYDGEALVAEYAANGTLLRRHVHWPGADTPMATYEGSGLGTMRQLFSDHQGSIVAHANGDGANVAINRYDEYGIPAATNQGRFQYTGQAWIPEIGMYYYKARFYSPTLGRFPQADPIGYGDGMNLYAYVGNDPVNMTDPTGLRTVCDPFVQSANGGAGGGGCYELRGPIVMYPRQDSCDSGFADLRDLCQVQDQRRNQNLRFASATQSPVCHGPPLAPGTRATRDDLWRRARINAAEAARHRYNLIWFRNQVRNRGPWDYKQRHRGFQDFGNYNYGYTGVAAGIDPDFLYRQAGRAQIAAGTSRREWGDPGYLGGMIGGRAPYGDDPRDHVFIRNGVEDRQNGC